MYSEAKGRAESSHGDKGAVVGAKEIRLTLWSVMGSTELKDSKGRPA